MAGDDGKITVHLEGRALAPQAVADAIVRVESLLNSIGEGENPLLTLTELRGGSAHITMAVRDGAIDELSSGLDELRQHPVLPHGWSRPSLQALVGLAKVSEVRGVEEIRLDIDDTVAAIDDEIRLNAEAALTPSSVSLGAVRGVIYRYINDTTKKGHHRREAGLRRTDTAEAIVLRFTADDAAKVRNHLEAEVEVWGVVARDMTGQIDHLDVEGIEPVEPDDEAPPNNGRGLLGSDWTGGIDPVEWVRMQRD
ncbi:hypothetical protein ACPXB3_01315 [Gordonia sp. DT219]|uniref:hypothetical protein n=1 Tax=Gordonia sp. DT219 TaxID=3416658 RepID=UPI0006D0C317